MGKWKVRTEYDSVNAFLDSELSHVHSVKWRGRLLDLLVQDRGSSTTLVSFHAKLTKKALTLPQLHGAKLAADTGCNLVAVSDPVLSIGDIDLAWYLGDRETGPLPPVFSRVISHAVNKLNSTRTILFGGSGGGYAATLYGQYFPDSIVLAVNPRLDLSARPASGYEQYLDVAHGAKTHFRRLQVRKDFVTVRLQELYRSDGLPFDLCIYQNRNDSIFLRHQVGPFVNRLTEDERLYLRLDADQKGHRPIPGDKLRDMVRRLSAETDQAKAIADAGFSPARDATL